MDTFLANVAFTLRLVRRSPGFYALVLALLTAGIGATTAVFSVVESVLLKPLPYPEPEALTEIYQIDPEEPHGHTSIGTFLDWRAQGTSFEQMALVGTGSYSLVLPGAVPVAVRTADVTADFFPLFRVRPLLGRLLGADDERLDAPRVAVIGADLWRSRFGGDPGVLGRTMTLNSRPYTIVGVVPHDFAFATVDSPGVEVWRTLFGGLGAATYADLAGQRDANFYPVVGRLRPGISLAQAQAQMTAVAKGLEVAHPATNTKTGIGVADLHRALVGEQGRSLWLLLAAVALVFVVISANVASLLLGRAQRRRAELATRAALGAAPSGLVLQVVTETTVLFAIAAAFGSLLASTLVGALASQLFGATATEGAIPVRLDVPALLAGLATSLVFGLAAGLGPALVTARVEPAGVLQQTSAAAGEHRSQANVRRLLVVTQLAVAFALLTGSGLAVKSFTRLLRTPAGFDPEGLATAVLDLPGRTYDTDDKVRAFYAGALPAIAALPGVESASADGYLPLGDNQLNQSFAIEGRPPFPLGENPGLDRDIVVPGFFATMRIPLLRGRDFTAQDDAAGRRVVILNEAAAARFFPGEDPVGKRISWDTGVEPLTVGVLRSGVPVPSQVWSEIVGVVADVRRAPDRPPLPAAYTPFAQTPSQMMYFVVRTKAPEAVLAALPRLVQTLDPELAVSRLEPMTARVASALGPARRMAVLLGGFALAALGLATLGLFGLVSYATAERTRELGLRLALGSSPEAIVGLVVGGAMRLVAVGLGIGLALSVVVAREVAGILPGVAAADPGILLPIAAILGVAGVVACALPALRAVRTPLASSLRYE